jgi:threonine/homoserine/homoserine lactone efflux protein
MSADVRTIRVNFGCLGCLVWILLAILCVGGIIRAWDWAFAPTVEASR